jgi:hypothetical protein
MNQGGRKMKRLIVMFLMIFLAVSFLQADVYVKNMKRVHAFEMMGKKNPQQVDIEEQWFAKNRFAVKSKDLRIVADLDKGKINFIIPKLKSYFQFPMDMDKAKLKELVPPKVFEIITSIKVSGVKVDWTGETKKIANWNCDGVNFEMSIMVPALGLMPKMKFKSWITRDVPFDTGSVTAGMEEFFAKIILNLVDVDEESKKQFEKFNQVKGIQVASEGSISLFGQELKIEIQCLELAEKSAPAGTYAIPAGYVKKTIPFPGASKPCCDKK